jgi:RimJ/RimL family protein N-acetyltransferase
VILSPLDLAGREALQHGDLGRRSAAPGWPHEDSAPGMSFLDSGGLVFLVIDDDGRIAGECGTKTPPGPDGVVEIGYGLAPSSRGRGLGGAAVSALVARLTEQPDVHIVTAEVHIGNEPSWRLLERLGFRATGAPSRGYRRYQLPTVGHLEQRNT